ncbi:MAG: four helix bundle protein [Myxococcales bacterium]|nr:four helix bundle protein [Myxococcales bacterium]
MTKNTDFPQRRPQRRDRERGGSDERRGRVMLRRGHEERERPMGGDTPPARPAAARPAPVTEPPEDRALREVAMSGKGLGGYASFSDIPAHRLGRALRNELYRLANRLPESEKLNLVQRLKHSATTITASLAAGFGGGTFRSGVSGALESRMALMSVQDHLQQLGELGLAEETELVRLRADADAVVVEVNRFLGQLARQKPAGGEGAAPAP